MKLIIGLGNPGKRYEKTRHNVGCLVANRLWSLVSSNAEWKLEKKFKSNIYKPETRDFILAKPQTFMNDSGNAVVALATFYKLHATDIYVIHDDLDIVLGEYKIQKGKGPHDHNGLNSIYNKLGSKDFWHVRVGIENRKNFSILGFQISKKMRGEKYVLQNFTEREVEIVDEIVDKIVKELMRVFSN